MMEFSNPIVSQLLVLFALGVFIVTGIAGFALGIGLIVNSSGTVGILKAMNRWVSLRASLQPMEQARDIDKSIYRQRRLIGAVFAASGAYTVFMLLFSIDFPAVVNELSKSMRPILVELTVDMLRWALVVGGVLAFVVGTMMLVSSYGMSAFDTRVNRWYSASKLGEDVDKMHLALDNWAEAFPRFTGMVLTLGSAIVVIAAMVFLLKN